jgi:hypothetical protein
MEHSMASSYTVRVILKGGQTVTGPSTSTKAEAEADLQKFHSAIHDDAQVEGVGWFTAAVAEIQAVHIIEQNWSMAS